ncbi:MAG TPA: PAS domain S-box protein [Methanospirillum sp.]|nr:PAS domain S-box protein [Methanospirillum sp.]
MVSLDKNQICEVHLKRDDGIGIDTRIEETWVDMGGGVLQVRIIVIDIPEQKKAEEKIRICAQMADQAPSSIMVHDFDETIIHANAETFRLHGYSRDECLTQNLHEIDVPESEEQHILERMQKILNVGESVFQVYHYRKDGFLFTILV